MHRSGQLSAWHSGFMAHIFLSLFLFTLTACNIFTSHSWQLLSEKKKRKRWEKPNMRIVWICSERPNIPNWGMNWMSCVRSWWRVNFVINITPTDKYWRAVYARSHNKMIYYFVLLDYWEGFFSFTCILEQTWAPVITFTTQTNVY